MNTRFLQFASLISALTLAVGCGKPASEQELLESVSPVEVANTVCPIMGIEFEAEKDLTATWNGKTIGFCCEECIPKWNKLSDDDKAEKLASAGKESHGEHDHGEHKHDDHKDGEDDHHKQGENHKEQETG